MRRRLSGVLILGLLAGAIAAATGPAQALAPSPVFSPYLQYDAGEAKDVVTGDFTGDGRTDVLVSLTDAPDTPRPDRLYLFGQGSNGALTRVDVVETSSGWIPHAGIAAGDFDGDGKTDAAVLTGDNIDLLLQRGGGLADGQAVPSPDVRTLEAVDLTGDGRVDLIGAGQGGLSLLRNLGNATFAAPEFLTHQPQNDLRWAT